MSEVPIDTRLLSLRDRLLENAKLADRDGRRCTAVSFISPTLELQAGVEQTRFGNALVGSRFILGEPDTYDSIYSSVSRERRKISELQVMTTGNYQPYPSYPNPSLDLWFDYLHEDYSALHAVPQARRERGLFRSGEIEIRNEPLARRIVVTRNALGYLPEPQPEVVALFAKEIAHFEEAVDELEQLPADVRLKTRLHFDYTYL